MQKRNILICTILTVIVVGISICIFKWGYDLGRKSTLHTTKQTPTGIMQITLSEETVAEQPGETITRVEVQNPLFEENENVYKPTIPTSVTTTNEKTNTVQPNENPIQENVKSTTPPVQTPSQPPTEAPTEIHNEPTKPIEPTRPIITEYHSIELTTLKDRLATLGEVKEADLPIDLSNIPYVNTVYAYSVAGFHIGAIEIESELGNNVVSGLIEAELTNYSTSSQDVSRCGMRITRHTIIIDEKEFIAFYGEINQQHYAVLTRDANKANEFTQIFDAILGG